VAHRGRQARRAREALALALILAVAVAAYRPFLGLAHLGWDTYPLILTSRVESAADLLSSFGEELMDGRYPHGHFYRPVTALSFALDHAVWGLDPFGYHLTDLVLLLACTILVAAVARRLLGPGLGPLIAALVYALHPLHVETLPVAARRADTLAQLFTLVALTAASQARSEAAPSEVQKTGRRTVLCALAAALAVGAKESGSIVVPLLLALGFAEAAPCALRERLRRSVRAGAPAFAAVGFVLLARTAVLGGIGGHPGSSLLASPGRGLALAPTYGLLLLMPQPLLRDAALARGLAVSTGSLLAVALALLAREASARRLLLLAGVWLLGGLWLIGISGEVASWYALSLLPAFALLMGALARAAAPRGQRRPWACAGAAVLGLLLLALTLRFSPLFHTYPEWPLVSARSSDFLARVKAAAEQSAPGDTRRVPGIPLGIATPHDRVGVRSALGLAEYSVEAWGALAVPGSPIVVTRLDGAAPGPPPRPDAIRIETTADPEAGRLP
jgi:hypothetical protein